MSPIERYLMVREKTHIFLLLETMVRRLDVNRLKGPITCGLYGENCKGNELTSYFIITANKALSEEIDGFGRSVRD